MSPAPVVLCADFADPADWFDLAFALRSPDHELVGVLAPEGVDFAGFEAALGVAVPRLDQVNAPANVVATSHYGALALADVREFALRCFVVGGHARTVPIDPQLRERHPERFDDGDPRVADPAALEALLTSGQAVIWLPRDICLWRYAAPSILEIGADDATRWLVARGGDDTVLLSSTPAFCLAAAPDPTLWLRYFRAAPAHIGDGLALGLHPPRPNAYAVIAIDGAALGRRVTGVLRAVD